MFIMVSHKIELYTYTAFPLAIIETNINTKYVIYK